MKMELAEMAGLQEGDTIFFIAAPEKLLASMQDRSVTN